MAATTRLEAIDRLKALAIIGVVFGHASTAAPFAAAGTWDTVLCRSWVRFVVPSFLFASGLLYALGGRPTAATIRDRWYRLLLPYTVVSLGAHAAGLVQWETAWDLVYHLLTASTDGIYYYVFLIAVMIPLTWPLSRMSRRNILAIVAVLFAATVLAPPSLLPSQWLPDLFSGAAPSRQKDLFWLMRDPLANLWLCYFLFGWLAGRSIPALRRLRERWRCAGAVGSTCVVVVSIVAAIAWDATGSAGPLSRALYTAGVIGLVGTLRFERPPHPATRFLSEASLGIYLLHWMPQRLLVDFTTRFDEPWGILIRVVAGLGVSVTVLAAARSVLGRQRSRRWLGA